MLGHLTVNIIDTGAGVPCISKNFVGKFKQKLLTTESSILIIYGVGGKRHNVNGVE